MIFNSGCKSLKIKTKSISEMSSFFYAHAVQTGLWFCTRELRNETTLIWSHTYIWKPDSPAKMAEWAFESLASLWKVSSKYWILTLYSHKHLNILLTKILESSMTKTKQSKPAKASVSPASLDHLYAASAPMETDDSSSDERNRWHECFNPIYFFNRNPST